jgi:uncharacterized protein YecT (DUF1311 family)
MRIALALVLAAAAPLKPPVIHETFTPLPCPKHPVSTLDTEGCLEQAILRTDRRIDAGVKAIFYKLAPAERAGFVQSERSWLAYRKASCLAEASVYAGGTESGVVDAACTASRNRTHLKDLAELEKTFSLP